MLPELNSAWLELGSILGVTISLSSEPVRPVALRKCSNTGGEDGKDIGVLEHGSLIDI